MGKYFGTDGFRGKANIDLNSNHAFLIGSFFGQLAAKEGKKEKKIVIGQDTRQSGDMFVNALAAGITSSGADAYILGTVPTPGVAFVTKSYGFNYGIMVSASHNPYEDNGIKVLNCNGEKLDEDTVLECEDYIDAGVDKVVLAQSADIGESSGFHSAHIRYIDHLKSCVSHSFDGLKIALDCANGSASNFAGEIFRDLGADVHVLSNDPNGVNINVDCGSTHIDALCKFVKDNGYDMGFAYDGDADRCLAADKNGKEVSGDELMLLLARRLKKENKLNKNVLVTTIMSNFGLYKALDDLGIAYEKTAVGDKYVYENMLENKHSLGGEQSGHIIFSSLATTGDGMLTSLMVVDSLIELGETLDEAASKMTVYPQVLKNVTVDDKEKTLLDEVVIASIDKAEERLKGDGRVLVRPSGTEPYVRVMAEASTNELCEKAVDDIISAISKSGHLKK
ncbi:MAG: phosphoglucosamine mutase [Coriobacteriia bacterium]|nr:phosphoglucosamine mutase [Coriobacteriia bacterium]